MLMIVGRRCQLLTLMIALGLRSLCSESAVLAISILSHENGEVTLSDTGKITIICYTETLENNTFPRLNSTLQVRFVEFEACATPAESYAAVLSTLGLDISTVDKLFIRVLRPSSPTLSGRHFAGLKIKTLIFIPLPHVADTTRYPISTDLLPNLAHMTSWWAGNVAVPPVPKTSPLRIVILGVGASLGEWGGCDQLEDLSLMQWELLKSPKKEGWLSHCSKLSNLTLVRMSVHTLMPVVKGAHSIQTLKLWDCTMLILPYDLLQGAPNLRNLLLINSGLTVLEEDSFKSQLNLEQLDLSRNKFTGSDKAGTVKALFKLRKLQELSLAYNPIVNFCDYNKSGSNDYILKERLLALPLLKKLTLSKTDMTRLCFAEWNSLQFLNVSENRISILEFRELPMFVAREKPLEIHLHSNPLDKINFTKEDYERLITLKNSTSAAKLPFVHVQADVIWLKCDCEQAWLTHALLEGLVHVHARCPNGRKLQTAPLDQLECDRFSCGECTCRRAWSTGAVEARCGSEARAVPRVPGLAQLHAAGARLHELRADDIPDSLQVLDISSNKISRLSASLASALFTVRERRVWLAGNPLVCDCENQPLLKILRDNSEQVVDYDNVTCVTGQAVRDVALDELCISRSMRAALAASGALLLALAAFAGALYYRFGKEIKVFLYARGWCLCCVREDELDANRLYDVFISFAHDDFQFVSEQIMPTLEKEYSVCVHYRDWVPGEMIPNQIVRSVDLSRRTVIILSRNFVKSVWGLMEFRTAHMNALRDGCVRLIIIVIDNVINDDDIDAELRGYLRTNTYLKWGDIWFWDKIRYALPHRRNNKDEGLRNRINLHDQQSSGQGLSDQQNPREISQEMSVIPRITSDENE